jgi:hypothetical protein
MYFLNNSSSGSGPFTEAFVFFPGNASIGGGNVRNNNILFGENILGNFFGPIFWLRGLD